MPGYRLLPYVEGFVETAVVSVPRVYTRLNGRDYLGSARARMGIARNQYKVNPGLYCVGNPSSASPVLVTANYKLSFDSLRKELAAIDAWILVVDTRGINVWCAAGKKTFSAEEIALQVERAQLAEIVSHNELILPQFSAPGVSAHTLKKKCGFKGVFGPIRAEDIPHYLQNGRKVDESMRKVTFTFLERAILIPVELALGWRIILFVLLGLFVLSGIGKEVFSFHASMTRGLMIDGATILAVLAGAVLVPLFLPWLPGRQFWLKGFWVGIMAGLVSIFTFAAPATGLEKTSLVMLVIAISSYVGMNFTGATPFTSLSGVEWEMRKGLAVQIGGAFVAIILWIAAPFVT